MFLWLLHGARACGGGLAGPVGRPGGSVAGGDASELVEAATDEQRRRAYQRARRFIGDL